MIPVIYFLDYQLRQLGIPFYGISNATRDGVPGTRRVDFKPEASLNEKNQAHVLADGHNTLVVTANGTVLAADGVDEVVVGIGGGNFDYRLWYETTLVNSGTVPDGTLEFSTDQPGIYVIEVISGNNTGYVEVIAQ